MWQDLKERHFNVLDARQRDTRQRLMAASAAVGVTATMAATGFIAFLILNMPSATPEPATQVARVSQAPSKDPFADLSLSARAAAVYDLESGEMLFAKNANTQLPLASLTKLMTAMVAADLLASNSSITITTSDLAPEGDSGFLVGERWSFKNLIDFTLITSSNDGARALASAAAAAQLDAPRDLSQSPKKFVDAMNQKASEIGMTQTFFVNETGLDANESLSGSYGSARDVAVMLSYAIQHYPELLAATQDLHQTISSDVAAHPADNTNQFVNAIPFLIASKTGYTDLAGGNLAVAFDADLNRPLAVVVLGSTQEGRFTDILALVEAAQEYIRIHAGQ